MDPQLRPDDAPDDSPLSGAYRTDAARAPSGGRTSALNLPGGTSGGTAPLAPAMPDITLKDGVERARNIGHAVGMICLLLLRYLFVKVLGSRLSAAQSQLNVILGQVLYQLLVRLHPHLMKARDQLARTTNIAKRLVLIGLIVVLTPLEKGAVIAVKNAKVHGARLAAMGTRTSVKVLTPLFAAFVQAVHAGFRQKVVQKALTRLIQILEEAQR